MNKQVKDFYHELRKRWVNKLTGNHIENLNDLDYVREFENVSKKAQVIWDDMVKIEKDNIDNRQELWPQYNTAIESAHITQTARNIRAMAVAYASKASRLYHNKELRIDILEAFDWLYTNRYNENIEMYKNWWDWDIGTPHALGDALILMYEDLTSGQIHDQYRAFNHFNPSPYEVPGGPVMTAANLLDTSLVSALKGLIKESNKAITEAKEAISKTLPYVTTGDGFYADGSFIQHGNNPYAGGYGLSLIASLEKILFLVSDTPWEVTDPLANNIYDWITEAFMPLFYKGAIMEMVRGREISRYHLNAHTKGMAILISLLHLSQWAPEKEKKKIRNVIKTNVINNTQSNYFDNVTIHDMKAIKELLLDDSISSSWDVNFHKVYGSMDRVVHHKSGFSIGISMYSNRVGCFTSGNGENRKGYHTSDGMLYLYNDDHKQYSDNYWPTADMMRLPGTTTDRSLATVKDWYSRFSTKSWVGGSTIHNLYGSTGMHFEMEKSSLEGKKSWFSFDDKIVALGAGISSKDNVLVETIVENRKIKDDGTNVFIVNGEEKIGSLASSENINNIKWAFLEGNTKAGTDSIGYYFPEATKLRVLRESRAGSWQDINGGGPSDLITKNYLSIAIEHGNTPVNEGYSYVILPNKSVNEVENYSNNSDIIILSNTEKIQAVRESKLGLVGMNFWEAGSVEYIEAKGPCSITLEEDGDSLALGISDPTQQADELVIILDKKDYDVATKDSSVIVNESKKGIEIIVDVKNSAGGTHYLRLKCTK